MDYAKYSKVAESSSTKIVNELMDNGWELIFVGQYKDEDSAYIDYSLGWPKEKGIPYEIQESKPKYGNVL